ncbi:DNA cytosine methyltransferase [Klebsiella pneumoniae]|jgi:DNA (cytosine-5)-methyltransferase 1|uniref:DNA cytosine methyltransferase n=1 Tax=Enterobacteriaceae TaxID=543 RepID=UPI001273CDB8|nr:DNA cytosine methyltransferase [Klebsiella pneumoniae]EAX6861351.1 DNA cytosine methyltransferase [Salmonella enterica]EBO5438307.1 DNA cytosine methyltransferase [Salmonella enterica]EGF3288434.1 DNA cytosine methyltransferase [Salmonella enterica]MCQ0888833.1 DNA cytosine methyltransferase [Klebsiella pneumoniae]
MSKSDAVVSLFAGAGGFSAGFSQAGLKPLFGAEINADACHTYQLNIGSPCHQLDLSTIEPVQLEKLAGGRRPFVVIGGPPCQGFSTAGPRNSADPRNQLIFNYLNIVERLSPRWFIFENVEGLLTSGRGRDLARLVREFVEMGYSIRLQKVNLASYGVPQTRKRVLIIGNRLGIDFQFPEELFSFDSGKARKLSDKPMAPSLAEAIAGLGSAATARGALVPYASANPVNAFDARMRKGNVAGTVTHHVGVELSGRMQVELLKPGQTMKDLPSELWHDSYKRRANRRVSDGMPTEKRGGAPSGIKRLHGNLQSLTITSAAAREFIHPTEHRPLTIRECARIQTFPDSYQWVGNNASVIQQIGNAVPPLAAEILANHLKYIDGSFGADTRPADGRAAKLLGFVLTEALGMSPALKSTEALLTEMYQGSIVFDDQTTTA